MTITRRESIRECKRLWKEIEKSGLDKYGFLHSPAGEKWWCKEYDHDCPLCEYVLGQGYNGETRRCVTHCPLHQQYGKGCALLRYDFTPADPQFFEAIKGLKE